MLSELGFKNMSCGRCYNEKTGKNDLDTLYISEKDGFGSCNSFYEVDEWLVQSEGYPNVWVGYSKEDFDKKFSSVILT